jgi:hypothetical protein
VQKKTNLFGSTAGLTIRIVLSICTEDNPILFLIQNTNISNTNANNIKTGLIIMQQKKALCCECQF